MWEAFTSLILVGFAGYGWTRREAWRRGALLLPAFGFGIGRSRVSNVNAAYAASLQPALWSV
jgi:hypothetical protein